MSKTLLLDASVILRYLLNDQPELTEASIRLFQKAQSGEVNLFVDPLVIADCCRILEGDTYNITKSDIAEALTQLLLLDGVNANDTTSLAESLIVYSENNVDFTYAYLRTAYKSEFDGIASLVDLLEDREPTKPI